MHPSQTGIAYDSTPASVLYQRHAHTILLFLRTKVPLEDAEDLLLEVLLAAVKTQAPLHLPEPEQRAWLLRVAYNKLIDHRRRKARRPEVTLDNTITEALFEDDDEGPEQALLRNEAVALLHERLTTLPQLYQEVLRLRFHEGLRMKAIGERLHKSEGAIRMILSRAMNQLRDIYEVHQKGRYNG